MRRRPTLPGPVSLAGRPHAARSRTLNGLSIGCALTIHWDLAARRSRSGAEGLSGGSPPSAQQRRSRKGVAALICFVGQQDAGTKLLGFGGLVAEMTIRERHKNPSRYRRPLSAGKNKNQFADYAHRVDRPLAGARESKRPKLEGRAVFHTCAAQIEKAGASGSKDAGCRAVRP